MRKIFRKNLQVLRIYEMVARLSPRCYSVADEINQRFTAGQLSKATNAKRITQHFFRFLSGKSEAECYRLLCMIRDGENTATELNYTPTGKVRSLSSNVFFLQQTILYDTRQRDCVATLKTNYTGNVDHIAFL